ncbi:MAG: acyl carrier protein [Chitinophagaceae bacterium]
MEIRKKVRSFIIDNMLVWEQDIVLNDDDNIFALGFVNSLFAMKLLNYLEVEFSVSIETEEMKIENFSSVDNICALVTRKKEVNDKAS